MISERLVLRTCFAFPRGLAGLLFCLLWCWAVSTMAAPPLYLTNAAGTISVALHHEPCPSPGRNRGWLDLIAFGQSLLACGPVVGSAAPPDQPAPPALLDQRRGTNWSYAAVDFSLADPGRWTRFQRHILLIEPDLLVIYDDLATAASAELSYEIECGGSLLWEEKAEELRLDFPEAGLTARCLLPPLEPPASWRRGLTRPGKESVCRFFTTNHLAEARILTVVVPHRPGQKRALGFKRLESTTALGARIFRDGFPTLVAFRTDSPGAPASLAGLDFSGPVAVDVFQPKRRLPSSR